MPRASKSSLAVVAAADPPGPHLEEDLINEQKAAKRLDVSVWTLRSWRCRGIGPPYIKMGRGTQAAVRYNPLDLDEFARQSRFIPSARAVLED